MGTGALRCFWPVLVAVIRASINVLSFKLHSGCQGTRKVNCLYGIGGRIPLRTLWVIGYGVGDGGLLKFYFGSS